MSVRGAAKLGVGSIAVFFAVATCSAANPLAGAGGAGSGVGQAGHGSHSSGVVPDAIADESGSRLKANFVAGTDGSKHFLGTFHDTDRSEDCAFYLTADGSYVCLPFGTGTPSAPAFADTACSQATSARVALVLSCGASGPKYLVQRDALGCVAGISSVKHLPTCYQQDGTGACIPFSGGCDVLDQPVPLSAFVAGVASH